MGKLTELRKRTGALLGEILAPLTWIYVIAKAFFADIDVLFLKAVAPNYLWIADFRFFALLGVSTLMLIMLGPKEMFRLVSFVTAYPLIVIFWKIPKRFYRQWPLIVVFIPAFARMLSNLRSTFILFAVATFGSLFILLSHNSVLVACSVAALLPLQVVHLGRSLRTAYAPSVLRQLLSMLNKLQKSIETGTFVPWEQKGSGSGGSGGGTSSANPRQLAYSSHWLAAIIGEKVQRVARRRHYDLYLLASWSYTVALTTTLFAFGHYGIYRIVPGAYANAQGAGFWSFLGFSFSIITSSNLSKISPMVPVTTIASYSETVCSIVILVILVFSVLTAARESFRENLDDLIAGINGVAGAVEARISSTWQITVQELEVALLRDSAKYVNSLRRLRGLSELALPPDATAADKANENPGPNLIEGGTEKDGLTLG